MGKLKFPHFWVLTFKKDLFYLYFNKLSPKMKKNTTLLESVLYRIGIKKKKRMKEMRNYTILVDSFRRKVYSQ